MEKLSRTDAELLSVRRPNLRSCAERTPASELSGVQLEKSSKIGRRVIVRMASKSGKLSRMDVSVRVEWRPKHDRHAERTPSSELDGVQNGEVVRNGRHVTE